MNMNEKLSGFWGIDKIVIHKLSFLGVDSVKLAKALIECSSSEIKTDPIIGKKFLASNWQIPYFRTITISRPDIGLGKLVANTSPVYSYETIHVTMTLVHGGDNTITSSMDDIKNKLSTILVLLKNKYGIIIDSKEAECKEIEIAYTFATTDEISTRLSSLILATVDNRKRIVTSTSEQLYDNRRKLVTHTTALSKKTSCKSFEAVLYCKHNRDSQLGGNHYIYRLEYRLKSKQQIKNQLLEVHLNCITDRNILSYISSQLVSCLNVMTRRFFDSIAQASKEVSRIPHTRNWYATLFDNISCSEKQEYFPQIIDLEAFLYISDGIVSRSCYSLVRYCLSHAALSDFSEMNGWQLELIYSSLVVSFKSAYKNGLGLAAHQLTDIIPMNLHFSPEIVISNLKQVNHGRIQIKPRYKYYSVLYQKLVTSSSPHEISVADIEKLFNNLYEVFSHN